ncbi:MAG TPA: MarR family transcriptional regulator [Planctomycetota bacterium]|jgi:DNA-binding MarR family transcriptional regulator
MAHGTLQTEIKQTQPFESPEEEVLLNLFRTSDRLQIEVERLLRSFGLTFSQYNVLRILRGAGKPLPCLEIVGRLITPVPAITGLIDRLEKAGLVVRERSEQDRRVIYIGITKKALELLVGVDHPVNDLHSKLLGHLSSAELKQLSRLLEKAREADE